MIYQLGNFYLQGRIGQTAKAAVERVPSPDRQGRGAPKYVAAKPRKITKKAVLVSNPTELLKRKLTAAWS